MYGKFDFGKVAYNGNARDNLVEVDVELRKQGGEEVFTRHPTTREKMVTGKTPEYYELSITGAIRNRSGSDILCAGQCLDVIADRLKKSWRKSDSPAKKKVWQERYERFLELYDYWKKYHLNGMHAGTPEQEAAIEEWKAAGNEYDYAEACEELKRRGLFEVNYTGLSVGRRYENEPYRYGTAWLVQELPPEVISRVEYLIRNYSNWGGIAWTNSNASH